MYRHKHKMLSSSLYKVKRQLLSESFLHLNKAINRTSEADLGLLQQPRWSAL